MSNSQSVFEVALSFLTNETTSRNSSILRLKNLKIKSIEYNELEKYINGNMNEIQIINLSTNLIDEIPLNFITNFANITRLYLDNNYIYYLPKEIDSLQNLITLAINNNLINFLPTSISKLTKLTSLLVNNNKLISIPMELSKLKQLKRLYLHNNRFKNLPCIFHELTNLQELSIQWFAYLEPSLSRLVKLEGPGVEIVKKLQEFSRNNAENHQAFFNFFQFYAYFCGDTLNPNKKNVHDNYLLNQVCAYGDCTFAEEILNKNIITNLNTLDQANLTPLAIAVRDDQIKLAKLLVDKGSKLDVDLGICGNHLNIATMRMNISLIRFLLKRGANPNFQDNEGNSALHLIMSIFDKNPSEAGYICELLLKYGANPNLKNKDLWCAVHLAARRAQIEALKWMINYNTKNIVILKGSPKLSFNLSKRGGDLGWTPLHLAVNSNHVNIVELLQSYPVNLFKRNSENLLPRHVFTENIILYKKLLREELNWLMANISEKPLKSTTVTSDTRVNFFNSIPDSKGNSNFKASNANFTENQVSNSESKNQDSNQPKEDLENTVSYHSGEILSQSDLESPLNSSRGKNINILNYNNEGRSNSKQGSNIPTHNTKVSISSDIKSHKISVSTSENTQGTADNNSGLLKGTGKSTKMDKIVKPKKEFKQKLLEFYKLASESNNLMGKMEQKGVLIQRKKILNKNLSINDRMVAIFHIKSCKNYDLVQICIYSIAEDFISKEYNDWSNILLLIELIRGLIPNKIIPNAMNLFKNILNMQNINPLIKHEIENIIQFKALTKS